MVTSDVQTHLAPSLLNPIYTTAAPCSNDLKLGW